MQVELNKATQSRYKIRHTERVANVFKINFSEGIGFPAKAALTFIRLKEQKCKKKSSKPEPKSNQTYLPLTIKRLLSRKWKKETRLRNVAVVQM